MSAVKSWSRLWSGIYLGRDGSAPARHRGLGQETEGILDASRRAESAHTTACGSPESTGCHVVHACGGSSRDRTALLATHTCLSGTSSALPKQLSEAANCPQWQSDRFMPVYHTYV